MLAFVTYAKLLLIRFENFYTIRQHLKEVS